MGNQSKALVCPIDIAHLLEIQAISNLLAMIIPHGIDKYPDFTMANPFLIWKPCSSHLDQAESPPLYFIFHNYPL